MKFLFLSFFIYAFSAFAHNISRNDYIEQWTPIAQNNMQTYGIPASIILAQGILESGFGNSDLARYANNHFGIKCHSSWNGERFYKDDDAKNECFRKYSNAMDSYRDHAIFLKNGKRYASLFDLNPTDYEAWAHGLKKAGYATNPKYAQKLIRVIEENELHRFDNLSNQTSLDIHSKAPNPEPQTTSQKPNASGKKANNSSKSSIQIIEIKVNQVRCVRVQEGQTLYRIAKASGVSLRQLYKYNDFAPNQEVISEGELVFLQPKRLKSKSKKVYKANGNQTLRDISQLEGVRLKSLMRKNNIDDPDKLLKQNSKIKL